MLLNCYLCHKDFTRRQRGRSEHTFCSQSCATSYTNTTSPKRQLEGSCEVCNKPCRRSRKFCSIQCYGVSRRTLDRQSGSDAVISWRVRTKQKLIDYKGGRCMRCGYNKCVAALHFHHRNPNEKDFGISAKTKSFDVMKLEVDKCDLLCSNCHAEEHERLRLPG